LNRDRQRLDTSSDAEEAVRRNAKAKGWPDET
jgi:hypothetical protein